MLKAMRSRKVIAAAFLFLMLINTVAPLSAYALTSGPTAPETTSFEPVDTTDMVNLQTGDFTYNIPLLEVPGPEGGYPLSLSYHAGIQPNEDASWVGLGWTLNPGAINRSVNGYPDDWTNQYGSSHTYWEGTTQKTLSIGISIGLPGTPANASFGLSFSEDTYRGFGVGFSYGIGSGLGKNSPFGVGITMGVSPFGDPIAQVGGGLSMTSGLGNSGLNATAGVGFSTNFESVNAGMNGGIEVGTKWNGYEASPSLLGISLNSGGSKASLEVGGLSSSVSGSKSAGIQTKSSGFNADIPTPWGFNVSLAYSKVRYWTDEDISVKTHGSIYTEMWDRNSDNSIYDNNAFDTYSLLEDPNELSIVDQPDVNKLQGGSYPNFDVYSVSAQGLGGNMRPYQFQGEVLGQNRKDDQDFSQIVYYSPKTHQSGVKDPKPHFRFIGDFSNSYRQKYEDYEPHKLSWNLRLVQPPFDANPEYGDPDPAHEGTTNKINGFSNNRLAGSRHIVTGAQIKPSASVGYSRNDKFQEGMIDGFSITNESGVTYHYGLPAYAWGEEIYQEKIDKTNGIYFNRQTKANPYAYTWYLTSITGPDFVDRNIDGKADSGDWGYWVNFEYGKWSNNYVWRNPSEGYHRDEDNVFQNLSMGYKEVYYLNAAKTRSHVALFEKDIRDDGKGASQAIFQKNGGKEYLNINPFSAGSNQSLKLSRIYLLNATEAGLVGVSSGSGLVNASSCSDCEQTNNVFDRTDVDAVGRTLLESKSIRIIDFKYDYSLAPGTSNSFNIISPAVKSGKLTLKSLLFRGKEGTSLLPPTRFDYELNGLDARVSSGILNATSFSTSNPVFEVGDLLVTNDAQAIFCGVITKKILGDPGLGTYTYTLMNSTYSGGAVSKQLRVTKNPPYNKDAYDMWGMYKSDINTVSLSSNENLGRITSPVSAKSTDVWSLRKITSPLGADCHIKYESDSYAKSILNKSASLTTKDFVWSPATQEINEPHLSFEVENIPGIDLQQMYPVGNRINMLLIQEVDKYDINSGYQIDGFKVFRETKDLVGPQWFVVKKVLNNRITVSCHSLNLFNENTFIPDARLEFDKFIVGNLYYINNVEKQGGGIRVKSIETTVNNHKQVLKYDYSVPNKNIISGVTSYEPTVFDISNIHLIEDSWLIEKKKFQRALYKDIHSLLAISREIPPPGVMYEYVTVTNEVKNPDEKDYRLHNGKVEYKFEVFKENMISREQLTPPQSGDGSWGKTYTKNWAIKKFNAAIGNIKSIIQYDNLGRKVSETLNHYLHDGLEGLSPAQFMQDYKLRLGSFKHQGFLQERYNESKGVTDDPKDIILGGHYPVKVTMSAREEYPSIQTGQSIINFVNGNRIKSENVAFDFYSGAVIKTVEVDAYGNRFMTKVTPAYRIYPSMGLKLDDLANKNMLTQVRQSQVSRVDASNNDLGIISSQVQTWSNSIPSLDMEGNLQVQSNVWRKQSSYSWLPDTKSNNGLTSPQSFSDFNFLNPSLSNANWKKAAEISLYDVYSHALEAKDIYNNKTATRLDYGNRKVILSGGPAGFFELAYSGVEDEGINQMNNSFVKKADGIITNGVAHTGTKSLKLGVTGKKGLVYTINTNNLTAGRNYMANVWVKSATGASSDVKLYYEVNGVQKALSPTSGNSNKVAGGWSLISIIINGNDIIGGQTLTIGCRNDHTTAEAYIDDFRFQPANAATTAYVYDNFSGELTHILDNNNLFTKFEYDGAGRLIRTYKEKLGLPDVLKATEYEYNYGVTKFLSNGIVNKLYTKQCTGGQLGSVVSINVPQGKFISYESPIDANAQAEAFAQAEANRLGTCTSSSIYARFEIGNLGGLGDGFTYYGTDANVYIRFYADAACTQPLVLSTPMQLTYKTSTYFSPSYGSGYSYSNSTTVTANAGTSQYFIGRKILDEHYWFDDPMYGGWEDYTYDYELLPNLNSSYIIKPNHNF